jgi:hypothetical protein
VTSQCGAHACFFIGQAESCVKVLLKQDCSMSTYAQWAYLP